MLAHFGAIYNNFFPKGCQMLDFALHLFLSAVGCGRGSWALSFFSCTQPKCKGQGPMWGNLGLIGFSDADHLFEVHPNCNKLGENKRRVLLCFDENELSQICSLQCHSCALEFSPQMMMMMMMVMVGTSH